MARLLILTALFCAVAVQIDAAKFAGCGWGRLECWDGSVCFPDTLRCDGHKACKDGSDEDACDELPSTELPIGTTVTARIQYVGEGNDRTYNSIELLLCGTTRCNRVSVFGEHADGRFGISTWTGCNLFGRDCRTQESGARGYVYDFKTGEVAIQIERRANELAVWREAHPEDVTTVPVHEDQTTLVVRPYRMWTDMPVQFTVL